MKLILSATLFLWMFAASAQYPEIVQTFEAKPNGTVELKSDLRQGDAMPHLDWADKSSTACFPGTQNKKFNGSHVLFATQLPPRAILTMTVIPDDKNANMSIYAYQVGTGNYVLPPELASCVSCEAEHKWDYPKRGRTQDHTRSVELNAVNNPYNVVIGVAGADGLAKGGFTLRVTMEGGEGNTAEQEKLKVYTFESQENKTVSVKGNLSDGVRVHDLSWASRSSMACFPGTQNKKFTGNHVIYTTEIPPRSEMEITVEPNDKKANFSIYAYQVGTTSDAYPPEIGSCVSCEAEHKWDYPKRGRTQDHTRTVELNAVNNPYKVVIGVVGADELTEGDFTLKVTVRTR